MSSEGTAPDTLVPQAGEKAEVNGGTDAPLIAPAGKAPDPKSADESKIQEDQQKPEDPKKLGDPLEPKDTGNPEGPEKHGEPQKEGAPAEPKPEEEEQAPAVPEPEEEEQAPGPDDVVCDSCMDRPRRALKSCLTCLVSYCETHLRPHLENPKFHSHRLVEPLRDIERRTCESHRQPLELYCRPDSCCICAECATEEHRGHQSLPVREARREIEKELSNKQQEMLKTMTAAENAINKLQTNAVSIESSVMEVRAVIEQRFLELQVVVEQARREVEEALESEERQAVRQAEGIRSHLEQKCGDLRKTQQQLERLTKAKHDIHFLQEYSEWQKEKPDVSLPGVYIGLMDRLPCFSQAVTDCTSEVSELLLAAYRDKLRDSSKNEKLGIKTTVKTILAAKHYAAQPDPQTRDDFIKYFAPLTFDGETVHKFLRLTDENRKVTNTTPWQHSYEESPERFQHWRQVLTAESFYLGRHYFEVDVSGDGTHVGVTYKSIDRKSSESNGCITGNDFSWCLRWNGRGFSAWHGDVETPLQTEGKFTRIGIFVDFARGCLAFYGVSDCVMLLHRFQAEFLEPLYPAFWLSKKENVVLLVSPEDPLPLQSPSPPTTPPSSTTPPPAEQQLES